MGSHKRSGKSNKETSSSSKRRRTRRSDESESEPESQSDDPYSQDSSPEPRDSRRSKERRGGSNSSRRNHRSSKRKHESDDSDDDDRDYKKKKSSRKITEKELAEYQAKKVRICSFSVSVEFQGLVFFFSVCDRGDGNIVTCFLIVQQMRVAKKLKTQTVSGYSNDSNPFGDSNLTEK